MQVIEAVQRNEVGSGERLSEYARSNIVSVEYSKANRAWKDTISSEYLIVISKTKDMIAQAQMSIPEEAAVFKEAEALLMSARKEVENVAIIPSGAVDRALGSEWWKSVEGKFAQATLVTEEVTRQLTAVADLDKTVSAIAAVLENQQRAQTELAQKQRDLEEQL